jgi:hypothetical protein
LELVFRKLRNKKKKERKLRNKKARACHETGNPFFDWLELEKSFQELSNLNQELPQEDEQHEEKYEPKRQAQIITISFLRKLFLRQLNKKLMRNKMRRCRAQVEKETALSCDEQATELPGKAEQEPEHRFSFRLRGGGGDEKPIEKKQIQYGIKYFFKGKCEDDKVPTLSKLEGKMLDHAEKWQKTKIKLEELLQDDAMKDESLDEYEQG